MANETVGVNVNIKTNVAGSIGELKALKKQLKETAAGSEDFKRLTNEIDDLEDKLKGSKQAAGDWVDQLASAPGPLGQVGGALNKLKVSTQSFGGALKATGIGLFVAALGGLIAAFAQSERATQKLQPLLIGFQRIFNGIFSAIEPVFDAFIDLATKALPYVTQGFGVAYSAITSFIQGIGTLGQAVGKLLQGDFVGAWDSAKEAVTGFGKRYDDANKRFISGTKEVTKIEQEELDKRKAAAEKAAEERKKRQEEEEAEEKKRLERQLESRRALLVYSRDELRKFEKEQAENEKKKRQEREAEEDLTTRKNLIKQVATAKELSKVLSIITTNNLQSAREQYAALLNFEVESTNLSFKDQEKKFLLIRQLERQKLIERKATQAELDLFDKQTKELEDKRNEERFNQIVLNVNKIKDTFVSVASEATKGIDFQQQLLKQNLDKGLINQEEYNKQSEELSKKKAIQERNLALFSLAIDTGVAIAGIVRLVSKNPLNLTGFAFAADLIARTGLVVTNMLKARNTINQAKISSSTSVSGLNNSGSSAAPVAPSAPLVNTRTQLDSNTIQQLGSATNRAYVVESDVTNSQERIRRINRAARLS